MKSAQKISFVDLHASFTAYENEIKSAVDNVLESGLYILGKNVAAFEEEFARYLGTSFAIGVASGTDAIILALQALGIGTGDEIIIPANSYPTAFAVAASGARMVLVDVNPKTHNIDLSLLEKAITKKTRAIVPVHLYGRAVDMDVLMQIAKKHKLSVVEDAAQAHGAVENGKKVGTIGDIGCFSFFPTKNLGGIGDGGIVVTANTQWAKKIRELRSYGEVRRYYSVTLSTHSRLDEIQAAFLRVKLKTLDARNKKRKAVASWYRKFLAGSDVIFPQQSQENHVYHLFVIQTQKRDALQQYLTKNHVETLIHFPVPIHLVPSFSYLGYEKGDFPVSEKLASTILSLPCYPELEKKKVERVSLLVKTFLNM